MVVLMPMSAFWRMVGDADLRFDEQRPFPVGDVQAAAILDVGPGADADPVHVAAEDAVEPDAGIVADVHVAEDQRAVGDEHAAAQLRDHALERTDHACSGV